MTSTGSGWTQLRQQTRSLETQTENLFHTYAQFAALNKPPPNPTEEELRLESQLKDLLEQRDSLVAQLTRLLDSEATLTSSALKQNYLSRHREILQDHRRELRRLQTAIADSRTRANLLSNVRSDIDAYRASNPNAEEADYMLEERGHVENSHNMIDGVLSQAYSINESFGIQRETLASVNRRIVGAAGQVPGINYLIGKIGTKKRRDSIILGVFIGLCFLMLLYFH
ncbi:unnamed protein product [Penicillium pancosmium]